MVYFLSPPRDGGVLPFILLPVSTSAMDGSLPPSSAMVSGIVRARPILIKAIGIGEGMSLFLNRLSK